MVELSMPVTLAKTISKIQSIPKSIIMDNYAIKLSLFRFDRVIRLLEEIGVNVTHR